MSEISLNALHAVKPRTAKQYAKAKGWSFVKDFKDKYYIYQKETSGQLLIPKNRDAIDYPNRVMDLINVFSNDEKRDSIAILNDLFNPEADILRFRLKGERYADGTAPLSEGMNLYSGSKRSIYVSALQVKSPQRFYKRISNSEIDTFISACKMGQTERGSFIASLVCPLTIQGFETNLTLFDNVQTTPQSFTRKVTANFLTGIDAILKTIDEDNLDYLKTGNEYIISSNFCDSIIEMQPESNDSALEINASLSISDFIPQIPLLRTIEKDYFSLIEQIGRDIRPQNTEEEKSFYGKVKTLNGSVSENGQVKGEVILTFIDDDKLIRAKVDLNESQYKIAHEAHISDRSINIVGILEEGARMSKFKSHKSFKLA
jgi:hypothetical protein